MFPLRYSTFQSKCHAHYHWVTLLSFHCDVVACSLPSFASCLVEKGYAQRLEEEGTTAVSLPVLGGSVDRAFLYCVIKMWYSVVMCSRSIRTGSSGLCYVGQNNYGVNEHASSIWRVEMRQWHLDNDLINRSIHPDRFLREENKHLDPITKGALISAHCSKKTCAT